MADKAKKFCGPEAAYYEHDWFRVEAVTRNEGGKLTFESCKVCKRTHMKMEQRGSWARYSESHEQVFFEGKCS